MEIPNIRLLDPNPSFYKDGGIVSTVDSIPLSKGRDHLNEYGALRLVPMFNLLDD